MTGERVGGPDYLNRNLRVADSGTELNLGIV